MQNFLVTDILTAKNIERGDLKLALCNDCDFVFNSSFDFSKLKYGENYDNSQTCSEFFKQHMDILAEHLIDNEAVQNCKIIEVGSGNGIFLEKLVEKDEYNNTGIGFDPSYNRQTEEIASKLTFKKEYYGFEHSNFYADVVISRHVIEHIHKPLELLKIIRANLAKSAHAKVFFETPCVEWILKNNVIWDFFYEHCSYFSPKSLKIAFENEGFQVDNIETIFGEQYLWAKAFVSGDKISKMQIAKNISLKKLAQNYAKSEKKILENFKSKVKDLKKNGKVAIWGAGAKGVTFLNLIDSSCELVDYLIDINPNKQEKYIVGTGHKVIAPEAITKYNVSTVIIMNPNYTREIQNIIEKLDCNVNIAEI